MDRFSDPPAAVTNLIEIALIKADASKLGISEIACREGGIQFRLDSKLIDMQLIAATISKYGSKMLFSAGEKPYVMLRSTEKLTGEELIFNIKFVLHDMKELKF